jgi:hypothetical protein
MISLFENHEPSPIEMVRVALRSTVILFLLFFAGSCQKKEANEREAPAETEKVASLRKQVMTVHDEAMPLMTDIYQLKNKLKERLQDHSLSTERRKEFDQIIAVLDSADQGMRVWMREFSDVKTTDVPEEEAMSSLRKELEKITAVKKMMVESVAAARSAE